MNSYKDRTITNDPWLNILRVREALIKGNFWTADKMNIMVNAFTEQIDIIKYDLDISNHIINIQVKKTSLKEKGLKNEAVYFYPVIICNMIYKALDSDHDSVIRCLANYFSIDIINASSELHELYKTIMNDIYYLANIANVQCISDNMVQIIL